MSREIVKKMVREWVEYRKNDFRKKYDDGIVVKKNYKKKK
jgi:hypothetical protein